MHMMICSGSEKMIKIHTLNLLTCCEKYLLTQEKEPASLNVLNILKKKFTHEELIRKIA